MNATATQSKVDVTPKARKRKLLQTSTIKSTGETCYTHIVEIRDGKQIPKKFCSNCEQYHEHSEFRVNNTSVDGMQTYCKPCQNQKRKEWYTEKRELERLQLEKKKAQQERMAKARAAKVEKAKHLMADAAKAKAEEEAKVKAEAEAKEMAAKGVTLLSERLAHVDEMNNMRMQHTTLMAIISALAARNGGELTLTMDELGKATECVFDMNDEYCTIKMKEGQ